MVTIHFSALMPVGCVALYRGDEQLWMGQADDLPPGLAWDSARVAPGDDSTVQRLKLDACEAGS